jgi:hypothetical protein
MILAVSINNRSIEVDQIELNVGLMNEKTTQRTSISHIFAYWQLRDLHDGPLNAVVGHQPQPSIKIHNRQQSTPENQPLFY